MITKLDSNKCTGCSACKNSCPVNAISMIKNNEGFLYPKINFDKCIKCNKCSKVCPVMNKTENNQKGYTYACYSKNISDKEKSSSGGIFILIAKYVLDNNGIVYGAAFDENFQVHHIKVDNFHDIYKVMGSKYVQSTIGDTYVDVKKQLQDKKTVLFSGTPCQIEGLLSFLEKKYENLITVDVVCHGVPSSLVWQSYLEYRKKIDKQDPIEVSFRNKDNGWVLFNMKFSYKNSKFYACSHYKDLYMDLFHQNVCLRKSCYDCSFKDKFKNSDITLGDLWGVDNFGEIDFPDKNGVSILIINSKKGKDLFKIIKKDIICAEIQIDKAIVYNPSITSSVEKNKKREQFFEDLNSNTPHKVFKKYRTRKNIFKRIIKKSLSIVLRKRRIK